MENGQGIQGKPPAGWIHEPLGGGWVLCHKGVLTRGVLHVQVCAVGRVAAKANYRLRMAKGVIEARPNVWNFKPCGDLDLLMDYRDELYGTALSLARKIAEGAVTEVKNTQRYGNANPEVWEDSGRVGEVDGVEWFLARYRKNKDTYKIYAPGGAANKAQYTVVYDKVKGLRNGTGKDLDIMTTYRPNLAELLRSKLTGDSPSDYGEFADFFAEGVQQ